MEEASGRATLVGSADEEHALTTTLPRSDVEEALRSEDGQVELFLDLARLTEDDQPSEVRRVNIAWEHDDLDQLLKTTSGDAITLAFDRRELEQAFEEADVEPHGLREKALVLTVAVATAATGVSAAGAADSDYQRAMPGDYGVVSGPVGASGDEAPAAVIGGADVTPGDIGGAVGAAGDQSPAAVTGAATPTPEAANEVAGYQRAMPADYGVTGGPVGAAGTESPAAVTGGAGDVVSGPLAAAGGEAPAAVTGGAVGSQPGGAVAAAGEGSPAEVTGGAIAAADRPEPTGSGIDIPQPARDAAIAGGLALIITAAGFALRGRRHVKPA
jgi:hypothetical protein